jgi:hypothetical protein
MKKLGYLPSVLLQILSRRDIGKPLAGGGRVEIVDSLIQILRKARYTLSADVKQHKQYAGTGRPGRFTLSKEPQAMTAYDGSPGGITTQYAKLPIVLRMQALGLHETAGACSKQQ